VSTYLIFHYNILDRGRIDELGPLIDPLLKKYNGQIAIGDYVQELEGSSYSHIVAYRFNSQESALEFYNSEEHQEISKIRNKITEGTAIVVPEFGSKHE